MEKINKNELKDFTKNNFQEERDILADKIKEERKDYFIEKQFLLDEIKDLEGKIDLKQIDKGGLLKETESLKEDLNSKNNKFVKKLWNYFNIKKIECKIKNKEDVIRRFDEKIAKYINLLNEAKEQIKIASASKKLNEKITAFYNSKEEPFLEYKKDEFLKQQEYFRSREIKNIVKEQEVVFVHGIHPNFDPSDNSILTKGNKWDIKANIVLSLEPSISTSTIKEGDTESNMWSRMGFVLNGGNVVAAFHKDGGTVAKSVDSRFSRNGIEVDKAISDRSSSGYNEFVVNNPSISGFYFCLDQKKENEKGISFISNYKIKLKEVDEYLNNLDMPFYLVENGNFFKAKIVQKDGEFSISKLEKLNSEYFINNKFELDDDSKEDLINKTLQENVFNPYKFTNSDWIYVSSFKDGMRDYMELSFSQMADLKDGDIIYEYEDFIGKIVYTQEKGKIMRTVYDKKTNSRIRVNEVNINNIDSFHVGRGEYSALPFKINSIEEYLSALEKLLEEVYSKDYIDKQVQKICDRHARRYFGKELNKDTVRQDCLERANLTIKRISFNLYGFAEKARRLNNNEDILDKVEDILSKYIDIKEIHNLIKKRADENDNFIVQRKDIE